MNKTLMYKSFVTGKGYEFTIVIETTAYCEITVTISYMNIILSRNTSVLPPERFNFLTDAIITDIEDTHRIAEINEKLRYVTKLIDELRP